MSEFVTLTGDDLTARIKLKGAELCSLTGAAGTEIIWQAGPAWPRHAPILFPIVGKLAGDWLRHNGAVFHLTQHGFARDRVFTLVEASQDFARFVLTDDEATRVLYPFAFRLDVIFQIKDNGLSITYQISNPGSAVLPASIGAHPAFCWPLTTNGAKFGYRLEFSDPEPAPIRRLKDGLLAPAHHPTPIRGRILALDEELFAADAIILDRLASNWVRFTAEDAVPVVVAWEGFDTLGLWSKPGAPFLCIEPWKGFASPAAFDGEFAAKPGLMHIPPGESRSASYTIKLGA